MRVVVLGAGLLGVTSAYYLQQLGHEVTVIDRHATPAAKARGLAPPVPAQRHCGPAAAAAARPATAAARLRKAHAPRLCAACSTAPWARRQTRSARAPGAPGRLQPQERTRPARGGRHAAGRARKAGLLSLLHRRPTPFGPGWRAPPSGRALGCEERLLLGKGGHRARTRAAAMRGEALAGATYALEDPARDPAQFAAEPGLPVPRGAGALHDPARRWSRCKERDGRIDHVELLDATGRPPRCTAHAYVLALGASSVPHAEDLGIDMPLRFVREYIITMPIQDPAQAPRLALRDRQGRLRIRRVETPAGDRLRRPRPSLGHARRGGASPTRTASRRSLRRAETLLPGSVADAAQGQLEHRHARGQREPACR